MPTYGKQFSDIYGEASRDTGDTTSTHQAYVKLKVNDALREICNTMKYSWLQREADVTLTASQQYVNMSDVASDWDEDMPCEVFYRDSANQRQVLEQYDDTEWKEEEDIDEGDVYGCHITKKSGVWRILFVLVPDSNFVDSYSPLKIEYQKKPTELSADADIPEIPTGHHQGLVYWTNMLISAEMGDDAGVTRWGALAQKSLGLLKKRQTHRLGRPKRIYPRACVTVSGRAYNPKDYNL